MLHPKLLLGSLADVGQCTGVGWVFDQRWRYLASPRSTLLLLDVVFLDFGFLSILSSSCHCMYGVCSTLSEYLILQPFICNLIICAMDLLSPKNLLCNMTVFTCFWIFFFLICGQPYLRFRNLYSFHQTTELRSFVSTHSFSSFLLFLIRTSSFLAMKPHRQFSMLFNRVAWKPFGHALHCLCRFCHVIHLL